MIAQNNKANASNSMVSMRYTHQTRSKKSSSEGGNGESMIRIGGEIQSSQLFPPPDIIIQDSSRDNYVGELEDEISEIKMLSGQNVN